MPDRCETAIAYAVLPLDPEQAGPFHKKRVGAVDVTVAGKKTQVEVETGQTHSVYVLGKPDNMSLVVISGDQQAPKNSEMASVRLVNLMDGGPTILDGSGPTLLDKGKLSASTHKGSVTIDLPPGEYSFVVREGSRELTKLKGNLEKGKAYTVVTWSKGKSAPTATLVNNTYGFVGMMGGT